MLVQAEDAHLETEELVCRHAPLDTLDSREVDHLLSVIADIALRLLQPQAEGSDAEMTSALEQRTGVQCE